MPISFLVDTKTRCVFILGTGLIVDGDITQFQHDLAAHPKHGAGFDQLADFRSVSGMHLTSDGMRLAGSMTARYAEEVRGSKLAIVTVDDVAFGMARVFAAFATEGFEVRVFREFDEATRWLGIACD